MKNSRRKQALQWIEALESRQLLSAVLNTQVVLTPTFKVLQTLAHPAQTSAASGITPAEMRTAYGVNNITFGSAAGNGAGQTIAIVDAYDDPTAASDLATFDQYFGLANPPSFVKVNQNGSTSNLPAVSGSSGWSLEESLDIEWAHVMAPAANIVLVEANSDYTSDLMNTAVVTAAKYPGVVAVSMSWSASEDSSETGDDALFTTPSGHTGVTFLAATGDSGSPAGYPANSPNVIAVGGTTLNISSAGAYISETGWSGSGGGISSYEARPSYQANVDATNYRETPDIALDADPNTGVPVYDTYDDGTANPWEQVGGTSLATPMAAGLIAVADQGRTLAGESTLDGRSQALPDLYSLSSADYHDITAGNNGYSAKAGYDLVTGLGSPIANKWVAGLVGNSTVTTDNLAFTTNPATAQVSVTMSPVVVTVQNSSGGTVSTDNSNITLAIASGPSGARLNGTVAVAAVNGVATFTGLSLTIAGNYTLLATSSSATDAATTSASFTITAVPTTLHLSFVTPPSNVVAGNTITPAVRVEVLNQNGTVDTTDVSTVTLAIASGPAGGVLSGTLTATTSAGIATFANLQLNTAGNYTLSGTDGNITAATSSQFAVSAAPAPITGGLKSETSINNGRHNPAYAYSFTAAGNGTLYSVTYAGGAYGYGSIIAVAPGTTTPVTVYSFTDGADQAYPSSGVAIDASGNIYGTTQGDPYRRTNGTIWELAKGRSTITTLYTFPTTRHSTGGADPFGGLTVDSFGNLYGTTLSGGKYGSGTVFELHAGTLQLTTLWSFADGNDGAYPAATLVVDSAGNLYGTTEGDGYYTYGSVYEITKAGGFVTLFDFNGGSNGNTPQSSVLVSGGNLYGTTQYGGAKNDGTIWKLNPATGTLTTLWSFTGGTSGANPYAGVITDAQGDLYGTTYSGGTNRDGTIYELSAGGTYISLFTFNGANGSNPFGGLYSDGAGNLYGTTFNGGSYGDGVVYELGLAGSSAKLPASIVLAGNFFTPGIAGLFGANSLQDVLE